ncbi:MAG: histidine phosphatase family protein [Vampirovibrionia bacterium]
MELILVRHGETKGKSSERLYGSTDIELSEIGCMQMKLAGDALKDLSFDRILTSPLSRSINGAKLVTNKQNSSTIIEDFTEIDFGLWEGLTFEEVKQKDPDNYAEWKKGDLEFTFPSGDSKKTFFNRIAKTAKKELNDYNGSTLAVLHKGVIKGIIAELTGKHITEMSYYHIELGSIHRLIKDADGWHIINSNETAHLKNYRIEHSK